MKSSAGPTASFVAVVIAVAAIAGCGDDRPGAADWSDSWDRNRNSLPSADELLAGGTDGCGELLGRLRVELDELTPTPYDELDGTVEAWTARAESLAFECPRDRAEVERRLDELDVLASEIDAGMTAETES